MTKDLLDKQKSYLKNIEEIQQNHSSVLSDHLQPPSLENIGKETPPKTAFPTPNFSYEEQIKNTVLLRKKIEEKNE